MPSVRRLHITLELVPGSDPICGSVRSEAATRSFTGWMQLITALEAAVQEDNANAGNAGGGVNTQTELNHGAED